MHPRGPEPAVAEAHINRGASWCGLNRNQFIIWIIMIHIKDNMETIRRSYKQTFNSLQNFISENNIAVKTRSDSHARKSLAPVQ